MPRRLLFLLALVCALPVQAQIYQWIDANGQQHFSTHPPVAQPGLSPLKLHHGYTSDGPPPPPPSIYQADRKPIDDDDEKPSRAMTQLDMCSEAVRWTRKEDLPNLKEIAKERLRAGEMSREEHKKAKEGLDAIEKHITHSNCLASQGKDRKMYECLSQGGGVALCSGALAAAFERAFREVQQRQER